MTLRTLVLVMLTLGMANAEPEAAPHWCVEGSRELSDGICYFEPSVPSDTATPPTTLVVFLHSLVRANSDWQWQQQQLMMRTARASNFAVLMPRGLVGIGPGRDPRTLAWPGSPKMQEQHEAQLLSDWDRARHQVESERGQHFKTLLIFGFSNGAYYATTLAVRGRYPADGYGIFAGGSGSQYNRLLASRSGAHPSVFVGYGTKDPAHPHMQSLVRMLGDLGWRHAVKTAPIGHWVSDAQLRAALRFLAPVAAEPVPSPEH